MLGYPRAGQSSAISVYSSLLNLVKEIGANSGILRESVCGQNQSVVLWLENDARLLFALSAWVIPAFLANSALSRIPVSLSDCQSR
jgi:hypothetical protein